MTALLPLDEPLANLDPLARRSSSVPWPLQLTFLGILLAPTASLLALGWYATRTRAV
jgi:hypothetical protein